MTPEQVAETLEQIARQWDEADNARGGSYEWQQAAVIRCLIAERDALRAAGEWLLCLYDGPRDEVYRAKKRQAWEALRTALEPKP